MLISNSFHVRPYLGFPFPWALLPVAGAACFISAGVSQASYINSIFASPLPVYIGALSYVIYLWHWPMVVLWQLTAGDPRPWWTVGYLLLGLAAVSMAVYFLGSVKIARDFQTF